MKALTLAVALAATALASPALAQACETNCVATPITVSFTEAADDDSNNPAAIVTGTTAYTHKEDGERSSVTLTNYFANSDTSVGGTSVYNLLETAGRPTISDQIAFSRTGNDLLISFISDPARFLTGENVDVLGSALETGTSQTVFDSSEIRNFPFRSLRVTAQSETEGPVPEPATWAMMLLGFGGIGFAMSHRRNRNMAQIA